MLYALLQFNLVGGLRFGFNSEVQSHFFMTEIHMRTIILLSGISVHKST